MIIRKGRTARCMLAAVALVAAANASAQSSPSSSPSREAATRPTREVLHAGRPAAMPGWELSVRRVTFAPGVAIAGEIHPGMQIVHIVSGELTLKVLGGSAQARRARPDGTQGPAETFLPSDREIVFRAGDTVLEPESLILAPRNAGKVPLVILASALLPTGAPHAVYIEQPVNPAGEAK